MVAVHRGARPRRDRAPRDVYWAARATLVRRPEDIEPYDRAFGVFLEPPSRPGRRSRTARRGDHLRSTTTTGGRRTRRRRARRRAVRAALQRRRGVAPSRLRRLRRRRAGRGRTLDDALRVTGSPRRSLRLRPRAGDRPRPAPHDARRAAYRRRADAAPRREPAAHRRLVLLLDISGSMEPYARAMLRFVQAAVAGRRRVEAFAFGTRLTRITRELGAHDPDGALAGRAERVVDWSGGTRLGDGVAVQRRWGVRGMARGADVVILSDGWDRGDPERARRADGAAAARRPPGGVGQSAEGHARLRAAGAGMAAALPYVDEFVEGHSLDALEELAGVLRGRHARAPRRHRPVAARRHAGGDRPGRRRRRLGPACPGAAMAVNDDGEVAGSVSGGCVEGAVVREALAVLAGEAEPRVIVRSATATTRRSPSASRAAARSACSSSRWTGERTRRVVYDILAARIRAEAPVALATVIDGPSVGAKLLVEPDGPRFGTLGDAELDRVVARDAARRARGGPQRGASLRAARRDDAGGPGRHAGGTGVHRVARPAAADVDLRRRRLHRRPGPASPRCSATRSRCATPARCSPPAAVPDGRRGARVVAATGLRGAAHARRARRRVHPHPRPEVRRPRGRSARSPPRSATSA